MARKYLNQFNVPLKIIRGDTLTRVFTWGVDTDNDGYINTLYDVTGYTAKLTVRENPSGTVIAEWDNTYFANGGALGTFTLTVPSTTTDDLDWSTTYAWDIEIRNPNVSPVFVKTLCGGQTWLIKDYAQ